MKTSIAAALAAFAFAVPSAHAEFSVQADIGASRFSKDFCDNFQACDRGGAFERLMAGYHFDNGLALELGYVDYGSVYADSNVLLWGSLKSRAITAGVSYRRAVWRGLGVVVRGGMARQRVELEHPLYGASSRTRSQPYLGAGLTLALKPYWQMELGADVTRGDHMYAYKERTLSAWYLGTRFSF
jgi:hypothetical protein